MDYSTDTAGFRIEADPSRDLLRIAMTGFFDADMIGRMHEARVHEVARMTCPANRHVTLIDVSHLKLQAQTLLPTFIAEIADPALRSRRLAFVVGGSLARMQVRRLTARDDMHIAGTVAEAEAYLFAPERDAAAAA